MFEAFQEWIQERAMEKVFNNGFLAGQAAAHDEEVQAVYDAGFELGHGDELESD